MLLKIYNNNITTLVSAQAVRVIVGFFSSLILVWFLGPEDRGTFALFASGVAIVGAILDLGMPSTFWILAGTEQERKSKLLGLCILSCLIPLVLLIGISGILIVRNDGGFIERYLSNDRYDLFILAALWSILTVIFNNLSALGKGLSKLKAFRNVVGAQSVLILIGFLLGYGLDLGLVMALLTNCGALGFSNCYLIRNLIKEARISFSIGIPLLKKFALTCPSYYLVTLGSILCIHSPFLVLASLEVPRETIAEFAVAYTIILQLEFLPSAIVTAYMPDLAKALNRKSDSVIGEDIARITRVNTLVILGLLIIFVIPGMFLVIGPLLGQGFEQVPKIFSILAVGFLIAGNGKILNLQFSLTGKQRLEALVVWIRLLAQTLILVPLCLYGNIYYFAGGIVLARLVRTSVTFVLFKKETNITVMALIPTIETFRFITNTTKGFFSTLAKN